MALTTTLPIYSVAYKLLDVITDLTKNMPKAINQVRSCNPKDLMPVANSYLGLLGQAKSHHDRSRLAKTLLTQGRSVNRQFTKVIKRRGDQ